VKSLDKEMTAAGPDEAWFLFNWSNGSENVVTGRIALGAYSFHS
jgi:hypothetical protein